jgi:hypothetical protein
VSFSGRAERELSAFSPHLARGEVRWHSQPQSGSVATGLTEYSICERLAGGQYRRVQCLCLMVGGHPFMKLGMSIGESHKLG